MFQDNYININSYTDANDVNDINANDERKIDPIGVRMKDIEARSLSVLCIPATSPFIVRLDGVKFSTLTQKLDKPFDIRFYNSMLETAKDLFNQFNPVTSYCHSDEISLVFAPATTKEEISEYIAKNKLPKEHINNGRVIKLLTIISGYCSARFNFHSQLWNPKQSAFFDSRLLLFDGLSISSDKVDLDKYASYEIVNHFIWRSCRDCIRNCVSSYGRHILGTKGVFGLNSTQIVEKMLSEKGFDFYKEVPIEYRHGVYIKKELISLPAEGKREACIRSVLKEIKFKMEIITEKSHMYWYKFLLNKYVE